MSDVDHVPLSVGRAYISDAVVRSAGRNGCSASPRLILPMENWPDQRALGLTVHASLPAQAQAVRDYLGITLERQTAWRSDELALKQWREAVENAGVFVFKAAFRQKDVSGFCLMDQNFPLIYLNNRT